ncbi:MAG: glycosyltransferase [Pseudomonadota bacterium]
MANILYITNGMSSTLHSSFEFARMLVEAGHTIAYTSPAAVQNLVKAQGYSFLPLSRDRRLAARMENDPRPPLSRPRGWLAWARRRRALRLESILDSELDRIIEQQRPDLMLIDIEMHAAIITTAQFCIPTLLPIVWFTIYRRPGLPPMHTSLRPQASQVVIQLAWWRTIIGSAVLRLRGTLWLPRLFRPIVWGTINIGDLAALARSRGYPLRRRTDRMQWLRPHLYRDLTVLSFNAWEMELPHDRHPNLRYVGPMSDLRRQEARLDGESNLPWRRFLEARGSGGRPLVYCSLGSHWSADRVFLRRVLQVFEQRPDWDLVLGLGGKLSVEDLGAVSPNVLVLRWAPQVQILRMADCAITHGGITTINECITCGVPMVVYSTGHVDQDGCAVRIEYHGLGVVADKDSDRPREIERNVEKALTDPTIRENVKAMQRVFAGYKERGEAVRIVEAALADSPMTPCAGSAHKG